MNFDNKIKNTYKSFQGYYIHFGDIQYNEAKATVLLEILDWVRTSNDPMTPGLSTILQCINEVTFDGRTFIEVTYQTLTRLEHSDDVNFYDFYDVVSRRIMAWSLKRSQMGDAYSIDDLKLTPERRGLIRTFKIPITIVQSIL